MKMGDKTWREKEREWRERSVCCVENFFYKKVDNNYFTNLGREKSLDKINKINFSR